MTQTFLTVGAFLVLLALLPLAIRWLQQRTPRGALAASASSLVSAIAVGPHQRVVTVEVGPEGARTWLVLGVTAQSISCLHSMAAANSAAVPTVSLASSSAGPRA